MRCRIDYINIKVDEISSGISENIYDTPDEKPAPIYDLMGRKVEVLQPGHIYICKGKKFISR